MHRTHCFPEQSKGSALASTSSCRAAVPRKTTTQRLCLSFALALLLGTSSQAHAANPPTNTPATSTQAPGYQVVHGSPVLPEGEVLGSVAGVGVDSHGAVLASTVGRTNWPLQPGQFPR